MNFLCDFKIFYFKLSFIITTITIIIINIFKIDDIYNDIYSFIYRYDIIENLFGKIYFEE
jgi:hypothetical protein